MTRILMVVTAGLLATALACSGGASDTGKSEAPKAGAPGAAAPEAGGGAPATAINANCPIMGNPVEADGGSVSFKGHTIGFCCSKCVAKFEALDDAGKIAALAKNGTTLPG